MIVVPSTSRNAYWEDLAFCSRFCSLLATPIPVSGAVFVSYASQDAEAAQRLCGALRSIGEWVMTCGIFRQFSCSWE